MPIDRDRPRRWWLVPTIGIVVLCTAAASLAARAVYQPSDRPAPVVLPSNTTSVPPSEEPGPRTVTFTQDVDNYPNRSQVTDVVQFIFAAIDTMQYDTWRALVTEKRSAEDPRAKWTKEYQSTKDGSIVIYRIDPAPQNGLRVLLSFTSVQDVQDAPGDFPYPCIRWRMAWPMAWEHGGWKLDVGTETTTPLQSRC